jgi:peptidoglycan hydrolase-like protein with peptidoglycan-binding domain
MSKKYSLSEDKIKQIARLCVQEQGCIVGVKAEASQAANLLETNALYRNKYGSDIYKFMRYSGWYCKAANYMDNGSASSAAVEAVRDVLCNGNRVFPEYIDEHDCITDIEYIKLHGEKVSKSDRSNYKQGQTIIKNKMGSVYTFWCFPAPGCDPFGYTQNAYNYVKEHGGSDPNPEPEPVEKIWVKSQLPVLKKGISGDAVMVWQTIVGVTPDGDFGPRTLDATVDFQTAHGLDGDGIVGQKTWAAGLAEL